MPSIIFNSQAIFQNQNQNGLWDSYWWTSPIYATSFTIQAYFINNTEVNESISKAFNGLLYLQQNDGSFIAVSRVLALKSICTSIESKKRFIIKEVNSSNILVSSTISRTGGKQENCEIK